MTCLHFIIKGKVQGVFYRATAKEIADNLGIKGSVKNTDDGSVEIIETGTDEQLNEFETWCRKGPKHARVEEVSKKEINEKSFNNFKIIR